MSERAPRWRLLETGARPGAWNMACDALLLERAASGEAPPTLRLYGWEPAAVSIGRHQPDPDSGAAAALAARGVEWVRRPTGGRAVYHGPPSEELTYAVAVPVPVGHPPLAGTPREVYRRIHAALAEGLRALGAPAALVADRRGERPRSPGPADPAACFATSVPFEIAVGGRKLLGSAQRRSRGGLLQHGSLPLDGDQAALAAAWPGAVDPAAATTLAAAAGRPVGFAEAAGALAASLAEALEVELAGAELEPDERAEIERRAEEASAGTPA
ncbi:MAG: octanoyltransferase [Gemmatimonadota bacterium]|nr:octanoyltransferase [Gemmatimonadota bacterium]